MDDTLCRRFFAQPQQTLQRRYEVLRAHFLEDQSLEDIAKQFDLKFYTVRALVRDFRARCHAGQVPPFLSSRAADVPPATAR
jgi:hypothetical protein